MTEPQPSLSSHIPPTRSAGRVQPRGDRTRATVIEETIRCVLEEGYAASSAKHIAERAGVTWGVIQYHFGDRDGLLGAVVTSGYAVFQESIETARIPAGASRVRIAAIIDAAWVAFSQPISRASLEIMIATRTTREPARDTELQAMAKTMHRLGERILGDQAGQKALSRSVGEVVWATLRGLVIAEMVTGESFDFVRERQTLVELVCAYLDKAGHP